MNAKDPQEFWESVKRMSGTEYKSSQQTIRNENRILLEGREIVRVVINKFENTFKMQDQDNQLFDRANEIVGQQYL